MRTTGYDCQGDPRLIGGRHRPLGCPGLPSLFSDVNTDIGYWVLGIGYWILAPTTGVCRFALIIFGYIDKLLRLYDIL